MKQKKQATQAEPLFSSSWKIIKGKKPKPILTEKQMQNIAKVWAGISTESMGSVY